MAFESLSQKLTTAFKKLRGKGKLSEEDIKLAMREVRIAPFRGRCKHSCCKGLC